MKTAVVILNWNTKGYLQIFLPGLIASTEGMDAEVIVADSASTDGSMEMLAREFPQVRRIPLDRNYGFTGGYNRALAQVEAEYFVLINSDIEVTPNWLGPLSRGWTPIPSAAPAAPSSCPIMTGLPSSTPGRREASWTATAIPSAGAA
ncbi:MAG: glycosyltransferase [Bacteroidales bacterium]|nr:glycosyltransferase [Bacteroidales bacterium]